MCLVYEKYNMDVMKKVWIVVVLLLCVVILLSVYV